MTCHAFQFENSWQDRIRHPWFTSWKQCSLSGVYPMSFTQTTTQPSAVKNSDLLHMSGMLTCGFVAHMPQPGCPVGWGCSIYRLLLCRGVRPQLWGMWSTPLLLLLPGPLWPRVVAHDKGPIYGLNRTKQWFLDFTVYCI